MWLIILLILILYLFYNYVIALNYWKKRGVPYVTPWPLLGNVGENFFGKKAFTNILIEHCNKFPGKRYVGFYSATLPTLIINDPNLIKKLTVKDFESFPEHRRLIPDGIDSLWSNNLFAMPGGEKWHDTRSTLSPAFTSSKLRTMFELMKECSGKFTNYFLKNEGTVEVEMKDAFRKFTNDVIATTSFGISCNSLENSDNEMYIRGKSVTDFGGLKGLKMFLFIISPSLSKLLNIKMITRADGNFFKSIFKDTMKLREEKSIFRPDMIHLLMEARRGKLRDEDSTNKVVDSGFAVVQESQIFKTHKPKLQLTDEDIASQGLIFYFAGFDTSSTMMSHAAYELAINPDIQERLRQEVDEIMAKCSGNLSYEGLLGMKYLDMVVTETLRKWPPFSIVDRRAVLPYTIEPELPGERAVDIKPGDIITIPVHAIHRDPKYYENPEKFDPERFSDENKHKIKPFTYLPFGSGPRNCIGSRFALLEGKLILTEILNKFEIVPIAKTVIPLRVSKRNFFPIPDEGFWLGLKPRQK